MTVIYVILFFDTDKLEPLDYKIYKSGTNFVERKLLSEFVEFGKKEFLQKLVFPEDEFIISVANGSFLVFVTKMNQVGCAILTSNVDKLDRSLHLVSIGLIRDYMKMNTIPEKPTEFRRE